MSKESFFEKIKNEVRDPILRDRLLEELNDHLEDAQTQKTEASSEILGDAEIIAKQTNSLKNKDYLLSDIFISLFAGLATFILSNNLAVLISLTTEGQYPNLILSLLVSFLGIAIYSSVAFIFYLAILRRFFIHYGQSASRKLLLVVIFYLPWAFAIIDNLKPAFSLAEMPIIQRLENFLIIIPAVLLLTLFKTADRWIIKNNPKTDFWLKNVLKNLHLFIAPAITFAILISTNKWNLQDSFLGFAFLPISLPIFITFLFWTLGCQLIGELFNLLNLPAILGFWANTIIIISLTIILPIGQIIWRRLINIPQKIILAIFLPLFIIVPFIPHDLPDIKWQTPLIWNWQDLEKQQLNITYPWTSALMQQDDVPNISYRANAYKNYIEVLQQEGPIVTVSKNQLPKIKLQVSKIIPDEYELTGEMENFSCDGEALENTPMPLESNASRLGMFGRQCHLLTYKNQTVVEINTGALIDLDLTSNGLLAISINMGAYDPTYVYVTDISELMK